MNNTNTMALSEVLGKLNMRDIGRATAIRFVREWIHKEAPERLVHLLTPDFHEGIDIALLQIQEVLKNLV